MSHHDWLIIPQIYVFILYVQYVACMSECASRMCSVPGNQKKASDAQGNGMSGFRSCCVVLGANPSRAVRALTTGLPLQTLGFFILREGLTKFQVVLKLTFLLPEFPGQWGNR